MVPANYFEIFHDHDESATYDVPRPSSKASSVGQYVQDDGGGPIYDTPPAADRDATDRDYDLPPPEMPTDSGYETYDRPPSRDRPGSSARSSVKSSNRISTASSVRSDSIYDVPPDLADVYDFPKPSLPAKGFEDDGGKRNSLLAVDISSMYDDQAEELLTSYRQLISATYESLFQAVYGPDAYWGVEHKQRRAATLHNTVIAAKHFDRALTAVLEFGKGVAISLESSSDTNFKKKYASAFRNLLRNRTEVVVKLEGLTADNEALTATVKSLLEVARTIPSSVVEFFILVQANKALLFKPSARTSSGNLPVITKNEVKSRPLPDLPNPANDTDYAIPGENRLAITPAPQTTSTTSSSGHPSPVHKLSDTSLDFSSLARKRNPNDHLPPLPHATASRPIKKTSDPGISHRTQPTRVDADDYDEIDKTRDRSFVITKRPSMASLSSTGSNSRGGSPTHNRVRRQSLSSGSGSSDEINSRGNSMEYLDGPYGVPNGYYGQPSSPNQPLRQKDRELLDRFSKQIDLILPSLREAVDVFLECVKDNDPPKDFVTKSKLTVVAAYKLVYIADALSQKILHNETKACILASSNQLTESIKNLVCDTKTAALQYPSVIAMDKMGGSLQALYPSALDLVNSIKSRMFV